MLNEIEVVPLLGTETAVYTYSSLVILVVPEEYGLPSLLIGKPAELVNKTFLVVAYHSIT